MTRKCSDYPKRSRQRAVRKVGRLGQQNTGQSGRALGQVLWIALATVIGLAVVGTTGGIWLMDRLQASLAQLEGEVAVAGLAAAVRVERDALGIHGTLFYDNEDRRAHIPPSKREVDWHSRSVNQAQRDLFAKHR